MSFSLREGELGGQRLVVEGSWDSRVAAYIRKNAVKELDLNYALGFKGKDLSFLADVPDLELLWIIHLTIDDVSPIHYLRRLRHLKIDTYCKTEIDFSRFPRLEWLYLHWRANAKSLFQGHTPNLRYLYLNSYSAKNASQLATLESLESLFVANGPMQSVEALERLGNLRCLGLYNLRRLPSLKGLENLVGLQTLEINGCRSLTSIRELGQLKNLRRLHLNDDREIESLHPIAGITSLQEVLFYESSSVVDGDLFPLIHLPDLRNIAFQDRAHYSHTLNEIKGLIDGRPS